jgi:hypothetical protein
VGRHREPVVGATVGLMRSASLVLLLAMCGACSRSEPEPRRDPSATGTKPPSVPAAAAGSVPAAPGDLSGPMILARGVRIVHAGAGSDAARVVREERERARSDGRDLVVYVGAKWCEPCQVFHKAAQKGDLDGDFPDLTLLEFDLDEDRDRLTPAGYVGEFIPLFAMPGADGRASSRKFEGSVKGDGAIANIAPRLRKLLAK